MVASTMPMTATRRVLSTPTTRARKIGVGRRVVDHGLADRQAGLAPQIGETRRDATRLEVPRGVGDEVPDGQPDYRDHDDLPEDRADHRVVEGQLYFPRSAGDAQRATL
jgi:hypothetical protein